MGTLIRLNGVTIDNADLPSLADFGYLPPDGLAISAKMQTGGLANAAGDDLVLTQGDEAPVFDANTGLYTFSDRANGGSILSLPLPAFGPEYTLAGILKRTANGVYFSNFGSALPDVFLSGQNIQAIHPSSFGALQTIGTISEESDGLDTKFCAFVLSVRASDIATCAIGGGVAKKTYTELGGTPAQATVSSAVFFKASEFQGFLGDLAFLGFHPRAMTDDELIGYRKGLLAFAATKNLDVYE